MELAEMLAHLPNELACDYLTDLIFLSGDVWNSKIERIRLPLPDGGWTFVTRSEVEAELLRRRPA